MLSVPPECEAETKCFYMPTPSVTPAVSGTRLELPTITRELVFIAVLPNTSSCKYSAGTPESSTLPQLL